MPAHDPESMGAASVFGPRYPHKKDIRAMKNLLLLLAVGLLIGVVPSAGQPPEPAKPAAGNEEIDKEKLDIEYAKTFLQLAQLELQRAMNTNRQVPGTFTKAALDALQQAVQVAQEQLSLSESKQHNKKTLYMLSPRQTRRRPRPAMLGCWRSTGRARRNCSARGRAIAAERSLGTFESGKG